MSVQLPVRPQAGGQIYWAASSSGITPLSITDRLRSALPFDGRAASHVEAQIPGGNRGRDQ